MTVDARALIEDALTEQFGEKCPDFAEGCFCCEAWAEYDRLVAAREEGRREGLKRAAEIVRKGMEFEPKKAAAGFLGEASRSIVSELRRNVLGIARDAILSEAEGA